MLASIVVIQFIHMLLLQLVQTADE